MTPQAVANPEDLEKFARELKYFSSQLQEGTSRLNSQYHLLAETWRDQEHQKFAREYEQTMRVLHQFLREADRQIPFLQKKAQRLREYMNQR